MVYGAGAGCKPDAPACGYLSVRGCRPACGPLAAGVRAAGVRLLAGRG